jgi:hypothetical protein
MRKCWPLMSAPASVARATSSWHQPPPPPPREAASQRLPAAFLCLSPLVNRRNLVQPWGPGKKRIFAEGW